MNAEAKSVATLRCPHWCIETLPPSSDGGVNWEFMWQADSVAVEREYNARTGNAVFIENKRCKISVEERKWEACYDGRLDRRIIRGTWFYYSSTVKIMQPFAEAVAEKIDSWFEGIKKMASEEKEPFHSEVDITVFFTPTPTKYRLVASKIPTDGESKQPEGLIDGFTITMRSLALNGLLSSSIRIQKGIEVASNEEEKWVNHDIDHVVFVVHGIGQKFFVNTDSSLAANIKSLRALMLNQQEVLDAAEIAASVPVGVPVSADAKLSVDRGPAIAVASNSVLAPAPPAERPKRVEIISIEWFDLLRTDEFSLSSELALVTIPNLQVVRQIANEVVLDVLLYLTPAFRSRILNAVCYKINKYYRKFCENNPSFVQDKGKCSVLGHSLGTVILFDLLALQADPTSSVAGCSTTDELQLAFSPHAFFALGSPLGLFLSIRNSAREAELSPPPLSRAASACTTADEREATGDGEEGGGIEGGVYSEEKSGGNLSASPSKTATSTPPSVPEIHKEFRFPTCRYFFNVFHPHDPVAYRIEPLLLPELYAKEPALVQHHDGGLRTVYKLKSLGKQLSDNMSSLFSPSTWLMSAVTKAVAAKEPVACDAPSGEAHHPDRKKRRLEQCPEEIPEIPLNAGRRVDFMLQENFMQGANEYISSITSHTGYFDMKDVARFVVVNIAA